MAEAFDDYVNARISDLITRLTTANPAHPECVLSPVPKRVVNLYHGVSIVEDECCAGQLVARLVTMAPKYDQRAQNNTAPCAILFWIVEIELSIRRCTPVVSSVGTSPSPAPLTRAAQQVLSDSRAMLNGILQTPGISLLSSWTPSVSQGACIGGQWSFSIRVDVNGCVD